ncbi:MAG: DapH/DapD/GlmU-related protein [Clostridium sp.]
MKLKDIIGKIEGLNLIRDGYFETLGLSKYNNKQKILTFVESDKYLDAISEKVTCIITTKELVDNISLGIGVVISNNPRRDFFKLHNILGQDSCYKRNEYNTVIDKTANVSLKSIISGKNVFIGKGVIIEENVIIRENVRIEENSIIRAGCIIGGEGFEFKSDCNDIFHVKHFGGVLISRNTEIQYNSCIDKALYPWDDTYIGSNSKLDNFVHLEHGVKVGNNTLIASRAVIGGRTKIGNYCWIGLGVVITNGIEVGDNSRVSLGSVVTKDVERDSVISGNFAVNHSKYIEFIKSIR